MAILKLVAQLGLDKTGFDAGMSSASKTVARYGSTLKSTLAGAFTVGAAVAAIRGIAETTNRIKDLSEQYAITTDEVQKADFALQQSGMAFEDLAGSINKVGAARRDAVEGNDELRATFDKYGISLRDLNDPQVRNFDLLMKLSDATSKLNLNARDQVELADLLGAKAGRLINVLSTLASVQPPTLFSKEDIESIDRAEKAIKALKLQGQAAAAPFVGGAADTAGGLLRGLKALFTGQVPAGSGVQQRSGGIKGRFELFADLLEENIIKPIAAPFADALAKPLVEALTVITGAKPGGGELFEVDKDVKSKKLRAVREGRGGIDSDALGRIGVWTGAASQAGLTSPQQQAVAKLETIHTALVRSGIIIKDAT